MSPAGEYVKKWLIKANNDLKVAENQVRLRRHKEEIV